MAAPCAEPWDWMDKVPTSSTHDLSVWSSSSLRRWHPRSSVPLVLTRHSSPIINERWTRMINLSMFFYYAMVLLLFWGHKPCIGFFFWWFNAPDALIFYTGSIEKLKLLGATYLPTLQPSVHVYPHGNVVQGIVLGAGTNGHFGVSTLDILV
jgi:hypothetical protein